ncbi:MAG: 6,7-dimethyl-8-ribityllumazine synthase [Puniceicoccales bacterium]|jgi:6,7-dimethyl-8-ribityllumazine synthase|nr:6,7-dimethyl-8-ribityllumazine synthase [Puniceicoccales bacterium]
MSQDKPKKASVDGTDLYFGIVAARYNNELVEALIKRVRATLREARVSEKSIKVLRVPGAAEVPYVASMLAHTDEYDCLIALGVVVKGDTNHNEVLAHSTAIELQAIATRTEIPVINGILSVETREQAEERVNGKTDRGAEFARAAIEMAWHRVQLGDYLDSLDAEYERSAMAAEAQDFLGFDSDDEDGDFNPGRSPFHKN